MVLLAGVLAVPPHQADARVRSANGRPPVATAADAGAAAAANDGRAARLLPNTGHGARCVRGGLSSRCVPWADDAVDVVRPTAWAAAAAIVPATAVRGAA